MHGLARCKHERRCSRARGADVSFRGATIKIQMGDVTGDVGDVTHRKRGLRFEKSQWLRIILRTRRVDFRAHWGETNLCATGAALDGGRRGKVIIERLCISLPYVETFNSKVIKGFVPELRSRYVFFVFRDFYGTLWTFCVLVWICPFHVFISGYVTLFNTNNCIQY